jgi:hypothetical protein
MQASTAPLYQVAMHGQVLSGVIGKDRYRVHAGHDGQLDAVASRDAARGRNGDDAVE